MQRQISIAKILLAFLLTIACSAQAAPLVVELSAEASAPAVNDLVQATLVAEAAAASPGELSRQVNQTISDALKTAKAFPSIKARSGGTHTYPVQGKNGRIESWRMRSEIVLESGDTARLTELLGKLQTTLGVAGIVALPAPETQRKAETEATLAALDAFKARAKSIAEALGKKHHIVQLAVGGNVRPFEPRFRGAARALASEAMPMPVEAGESQISVNVSGKIELE